jgi:hypothetical protein
VLLDLDFLCLRTGLAIPTWFLSAVVFQFDHLRALAALVLATESLGAVTC